ncbi:hypothetical protein OG875_05400 [Streptomyces sp. NBC_01498]|uniref:hypothetical protein n=1 Tax=Streptomyces sp. NBC_01498 TaxID=2975870 RepID=UPI002E7BAA7A|nr:hypothetical protein [Streptomyces sp. NBC_01498]WTL24091.1 hypothetical protein OG875_05400 [Streptomyces sp. NBC_01498]
MKRIALAPRAVRQLRRVRSVYLVGTLLSVLGLFLQSGRVSSGRQAEIAMVLVVVFAGLLAVTVVQLWRHQRTVHCGTSKRLTRRSV